MSHFCGQSEEEHSNRVVARTAPYVKAIIGGDIHRGSIALSFLRSRGSNPAFWDLRTLNIEHPQNSLPSQDLGFGKTASSLLLIACFAGHPYSHYLTKRGSHLIPRLFGILAARAGDRVLG